MYTPVDIGIRQGYADHMSTDQQPNKAKHPRYKGGTLREGFPRRSLAAGSNFVQIGDPAHNADNTVEGTVAAFSETLITIRTGSNDYAHVTPDDIRYGLIPDNAKPVTKLVTLTGEQWDHLLGCTGWPHLLEDSYRHKLATALLEAGEGQ